MEGLGQAAQPQPMPERGPQVPQAGYQEQAGGGKQATPEQQEQYNLWVVAGMRALFNENVSESTIKAIQGEQNKVIGVAKALAALVTRLYTTQVKQGRQPPSDVVLHGSWELLDNVIMMAEAAGMGQFTPDEREGAFFRAADIFRTNLAKGGMIDKGVVDQDVNALRQMEDSGEMAQMAGHFAQQAPQGEPEV